MFRQPALTNSYPVKTRNLRTGLIAARSAASYSFFKGSARLTAYSQETQLLIYEATLNSRSDTSRRMKAQPHVKNLFPSAPIRGGRDGDRTIHFASDLFWWQIISGFLRLLEDYLLLGDHVPYDGILNRA